MSLTLRSQIALQFCHAFKRSLADKPMEDVPKALHALFDNQSLIVDAQSCYAEKTQMNGVPAEWLQPESAADTDDVLLYLHGGGYMAGCLASYRGTAYAMAEKFNAKCLLIEYRLIPEHTFNDACEDAFQAYMGLISQGVDARNIIVAGDSSGAHLAFMLMQYIHSQKVVEPKALVCFSPLLNFSSSKDAFMRDEDALVPAQLMMQVNELLSSFLSEDELMAADISQMNFKGFPPVFIAAGDNEILSDDACTLYQLLVDAGVEAELYLCPDMPHSFIMLHQYLSEVKKVYALAENFVATAGKELPFSEEAFQQMMAQESWLDKVKYMFN